MSLAPMLVRCQRRAESCCAPSTAFFRAVLGGKKMIGNDELDLLAGFEQEPREVQTELVEWEEVGPRCYTLRLRSWDFRGAEVKR